MQPKCDIGAIPTLRKALRATAIGLILLAGVSPLASYSQALQEYGVTILGEAAGKLTSRSDQGTVQVDFSYRNNGRGPDLKEEFRVDTLGAPVFYRGQGKSTFGNAIEESYDWRDARGRWVSLVDKGDQAVPAGALYFPVEASSLFGAQLVRSLLLRPARSAPSVAGGQFSTERIAQLSLTSSKGPVEVSLYALNGADIGPLYYWLRDEGDKPFFATVSPFLQLVSKGYEEQGRVLLERQLQAQTERLEKLQRNLARPLPGLTVIRNVRWFDSRAGEMKDPADVYIYEGKISSIEPVGSAARNPEQSIDGTGKTLLPGLFDMHCHADRESGLLYLAAGVTSIRDMGNFNDKLEELRNQINTGVIPGPRIQPLGFIEGRSEFSARFGVVVDSVEAGKAAIDWYAQRDFIQIKLYNSIKPEWVKPLAAYAHERGLRVGGHIPAFMRAEEAVRDGYDEIQHINQVMLNFLVKNDDDTRTLLRFSLPGDKAREVDLDGAAAQSFLRLLRDRKTVVDATLSVFEPVYLQQDGQANPAYGMIANHLPVVVQRSLLSAQSEINDENAARYRESFAKMLAFVGRMYAAGVPLVAGTDDFPGFALHRELELLVQAGIKATEVLRIATWNGALYTKTLNDRGSIERGKLADLVLIDGDPAKAISDIRKASLVIKGGIAYEPASIYKALDIRPFTSSASIQSAAPATR